MENKKNTNLILILGLCAFCLAVVVISVEGKVFLKRFDKFYLSISEDILEKNELEEDFYGDGWIPIGWAADPMVINYLPACPIQEYGGSFPYREIGEVYAKNYHCSWNRHDGNYHSIQESQPHCTLTTTDPCHAFIETCPAVAPAGDACWCNNREAICAISVSVVVNPYSGPSAVYTECWAEGVSYNSGVPYLNGELFATACEFCVIK